jgi:peptide chain release factor 2
MRRLSSLRDEVQEWRSLEREARSIDDLLTLALEERDGSLLDTLQEEVEQVSSKLQDLEFKLVLSGEYDRRDAILALHAGAGGVESQDWVEMLVRMYLRWAERKGFSTQVLDISPGEEAGF